MLGRVVTQVIGVPQGAIHAFLLGETETSGVMLHHKQERCDIHVASVSGQERVLSHRLWALGILKPAPQCPHKAYFPDQSTKLENTAPPASLSHCVKCTTRQTQAFCSLGSRTFQELDSQSQCNLLSSSISSSIKQTYMCLPPTLSWPCYYSK